MNSLSCVGSKNTVTTQLRVTRRLADAWLDSQETNVPYSKANALFILSFNIPKSDALFVYMRALKVSR